MASPLDHLDIGMRPGGAAAPKLERSRFDRIEDDERAAIAEYEARKGITRVAPGVSGLPEEQSREERREMEKRISRRQRKFWRCRRDRAAPAARSLAEPACAPAAPAAEPRRGDMVPDMHRRNTENENMDGLQPLPPVKARIEGGAYIASWQQHCSFDQVPVAALRIRGNSYQREMGRNSARRVARIAQGFDWSQFGALTVCQVGEVYEVIDGQHRAAAARLRGIGRVPAIVVRGEGAVAFLGLNRDRAHLDAAQLYHAELVAGAREAVAIAAILDRLGIVVPRSSSQRALPPLATRAVGVLRQEMRARGADVLAGALWVLVEAWRDQAGALSADLIRALARVVAEIAAAPDLSGDEAAEQAALVDTLRSRAPEEWRRLARASAAEYGGAAHTHMARLICNTHAERGGVEIAVGV